MSAPAGNAGVGFPNRLFDDGRHVLSQFGYRPVTAGAWFEDWAEMWAKLKSDFLGRRTPAVPDFGALSADQQAAAQEYMELRLQADRRLMACEKAHKEILRAGIDVELVELYTAAREAYEDTVFAFGDARARLAGML